MNFRISKKLLCVVLAVLLVSAVCSLTGCAGNKAPEAPTAPVQPTLPSMPHDVYLPPDVFTDAPVPDEAASEISEALQNVVEFTLEVTGKDGVTKSQTVSTDCQTVGEALLAYGMIEGDAGDYGLYVKTVLGETLDYEKDGLYWAFYINGEYASSGVELTQIEPGAVYAFRAEK